MLLLPLLLDTLLLLAILLILTLLYSSLLLVLLLSLTLLLLSVFLLLSVLFLLPLWFGARLLFLAFRLRPVLRPVLGPWFSLGIGLFFCGRTFVVLLIWLLRIAGDPESSNNKSQSDYADQFHSPSSQSS